MSFALGMEVQSVLFNILMFYEVVQLRAPNESWEYTPDKIDT